MSGANDARSSSSIASETTISAEGMPPRPFSTDALHESAHPRGPPDRICGDNNGNDDGDGDGEGEGEGEAEADADADVDDDDDDDDDAADAAGAAADDDAHHDLVLGPLLPLKQQLEKDKEDESLRRWKEQLLGSIPLVDDGSEDDGVPQVSLLSMSILSPGRPEMDIPLPSVSTYKTHLFTLKEGSKYKLQFRFAVRKNIVSGLTYVHTVWKSGIKVDKIKVMLGTFAPQLEPHVVAMEEETTPSGMLARGTYTAKTKFIDDDGRCHFQMEHSFSIRKDW